MTPCVFLAGIVMPAALRYRSLFHALGAATRPIAQELVLYDAFPGIPESYSIDMEIDALDRVTRTAGLEAFHLYGHSGGGAIALAYVAAHPDRVLSLALDEPSSDFSDEDFGGPYWSEIQALAALPSEEQIPAFRRLQVKPGLALAPLAEPRPSWMADGPARIAAFSAAVPRHRISAERYGGFKGPVYYSYGSLTHPRYERLRERLAAVFADFQAELYEGLHHLECSHQAEPVRVGAALRELWRRSGAA